MADAESTSKKSYPKPEASEYQKPSVSTSKAKTPQGKLLLADEVLLARKPNHERTGQEYEAAALELYNARLTADYNDAVTDFKRRGLDPNKVPRPRVYTAADVLSSQYRKNPEHGDRVWIITTDAKKFVYQL